MRPQFLQVSPGSLILPLTATLDEAQQPSAGTLQRSLIQLNRIFSLKASLLK